MHFPRAAPGRRRAGRAGVVRHRPRRDHQGHRVRCRQAAGRGAQRPRGPPISTPSTKRRSPCPPTDDTLLVLSADARGVVMRPEGSAERTPPRPRRPRAPNRFANPPGTVGRKHGRKADGDFGYGLRRQPRRAHPGRRHHPARQRASGSGSGSGGGSGGAPTPRRKGPTATAEMAGRLESPRTARRVIGAVFDQATARDPHPPPLLGRARRRAPATSWT